VGQFMWITREMRALLLGAATLTALGGCQYVGPKSIDVGRGRYNSIIQSTSMEQTMSNIVRVYHHEPPTFIDVTEVDATVAFTSSASAGAGLSFSKAGTSGKTPTVTNGSTGSLSGGLGYSETPTVRYQPLLGQALVAQLVTPVSVDALGLLYDSSWDVSALFDFSAAYLTLDPREFYSALETITELHDKESVELVATQSWFSKQSGGGDQGGAGGGKSSSHGADALVIYLLPNHEYGAVEEKKRILQLWVRMFRFYHDNQPPFVTSVAAEKTCQKIGLSLDPASLRDWDVNIDTHITGSSEDMEHELRAARSCLPNSIELRVVPASAPAAPGPVTAGAKSKKGARNAGHGAVPGFVTSAPLMRTFSALGILKNATELPDPRIEFASPEMYRQIRGDSWNADVERLSYYTVSPDQLDSFNCPPAQKQTGGCESEYPAGMSLTAAESLNGEVVQWLQAGNMQGATTQGASAALAATHPDGVGVFEEHGKDMLDERHINLNGRLGSLRRYVLVIVDDQPPSDPVYVSYSDGEHWYYIAKDDTVSQKNFQLISLFMSMMAVPPSTQPLSPVINVGG
jgi:hypothetical protein